MMMINLIYGNYCLQSRPLHVYSVSGLGFKVRLKATSQARIPLVIYCGIRMVVYITAINCC